MKTYLIDFNFLVIIGRKIQVKIKKNLFDYKSSSNQKILKLVLNIGDQCFVILFGKEIKTFCKICGSVTTLLVVTFCGNKAMMHKSNC